MQFTIDKPSLRAIRPQIEAALKVIAKANGCTLSLGNCRFTSDLATFKLNLTPNGAHGQSVSAEAAAFKSRAWVFGLKAADLGSTFKFGGQTYTITGLKPRSRRYPILAKNDNGKTFKFPVEAVKGAR